jgi:hypothetical protein
MNLSFRDRVAVALLQTVVFAGVLALSGCAAREPEDPGYNKPAVSGVVSGEIHSMDDYLDAVRKENERRIRTEGDVWSNPEDF